MNFMVWILLILCLIYIYFQFKRFSFIKNKKKPYNYLVPLAMCLPFIIVAIFYLWGVAIFVVHLMLFYMIANLIVRIKNKGKIIHANVLNGIVLGFTAVIMSIALFVLSLHIFETKYDLKTDKTDESLRIAQITDVHLGCTLDGKSFSKRLSDIEKTNPDLLVIVGDFVDDETKKSDMIGACKALGRFKTKYGVFFILGNHDKGYYNSNYRGFSLDDLYDELLKNNVIILHDEVYNLTENYVLVGRYDRSFEGRMEALELTKNISKDKYIIMLDHQPNDYANEKDMADLVLSGHTHGGNLFPINFIVMASNDQTYGIKTIDSTTFIVSSGISQWAIPYNTCIFNEYVLIDINR